MLKYTDTVNTVSDTTPIHFLNPRQIVDFMFTKHASLTGPDLKKLRAPLFEPLQAVAELEAHMGKFVLVSLKLSATGHGEDSYRYLELFLESIKGFPWKNTQCTVSAPIDIPYGIQLRAKPHTWVLVKIQSIFDKLNITEYNESYLYQGYTVRYTMEIMSYTQ